MTSTPKDNDYSLESTPLSSMVDLSVSKKKGKKKVAPEKVIEAMKVKTVKLKTKEIAQSRAAQRDDDPIENESDEEMITYQTPSRVTTRQQVNEESPPNELVAQPDQNMDSDDIPDSDNGSDFIIMEIDKNTSITPAGSSYSRMACLIKSFSREPYAYSGDHMSPFRGLMGEMKDASDKEKADAISALLKENRDKKILMVVSGRNSTEATKRSANRVIEDICRSTPVEVTHVRASAWMVVRLRSKEDVQKALAQKAVYDPVKETVILMREVRMTPARERVFEVREVRSKEDLIDLKDALVRQGVKVVKEDPAPDLWTSVYKERVIWKVKASDKKWITPKYVTTMSGNRLTLVNAPVCKICHSDDHHLAACPWEGILPDVKFQKGAGSRKHIQ